MRGSSPSARGRETDLIFPRQEKLDAEKREKEARVEATGLRHDLKGPSSLANNLEEEAKTRDRRLLDGQSAAQAARRTTAPDDSAGRWWRTLVVWTMAVAAATTTTMTAASLALEVMWRRFFSISCGVAA